MSGLIYAIRCNDLVKIGHSANPKRRFVTLIAGNPYECELVGATPGTIDDERALHLRLADFRLRREWYHEIGPVAAYVRTLTPVFDLEEADCTVLQSAAIAMRKAKKLAGGSSALAHRLGIRPQAVSQWKLCPLDRVREVGRIVGMTHQELRPDLLVIRETAA